MSERVVFCINCIHCSRPEYAIIADCLADASAKISPVDGKTKYLDCGVMRVRLSHEHGYDCPYFEERPPDPAKRSLKWLADGWLKWLLRSPRI